MRTYFLHHTSSITLFCSYGEKSLFPVFVLMLLFENEYVARCWEKYAGGAEFYPCFSCIFASEKERENAGIREWVNQEIEKQG